MRDWYNEKWSEGDNLKIENYKQRDVSENPNVIGAKVLFKFHFIIHGINAMAMHKT